MKIGMRAGTVLVTLALTTLIATTASADPRSMVGSILVENPSAGFELAPGVYGRKVGGAGPKIFPPNAAVPSLSVAGTTAGTFVGRQVTLPASRLNRTGFEFRDFPAFGNVGQVSKSFMTVQGAATFAENQGALANCPGDGCNTAGTAISWCPPNTHVTTAPAPGTAGAQVGNWNCGSWQAGAGGGDRFLRVAISNASARNNFGGTFTLLRNHAMNVWRVPVAPSTPNASDAEATRSWMDITNLAWSGGRSNFEFTALGGNNGPRVIARLNDNGAVISTFGCTNGAGTAGGTLMAGVGPPVLNAGSNCGTDPAPNAPGQGWGFKMTTGTISGSDPYPFGAIVTTVAGTPFNPNFQAGAQPASQGFFFSRMGNDSLTTTAAGPGRNIVMLGGGIAVDPDSGNAFFRITRLEMNLVAPEPAAGAALFAGVGLLAAVARRRAKR